MFAVHWGKMFQAHPSGGKNYLHEFTHYRFTRVGPTSNNNFYTISFY